MPKVFAYATGPYGPGIRVAFLAEDGTIVTRGLVRDRAQGLTETQEARQKLFAQFPGGFELVDLSDQTPEQLEAHPEFTAARAAERARHG